MRAKRLVALIDRREVRRDFYSKSIHPFCEEPSHSTSMSPSLEPNGQLSFLILLSDNLGLSLPYLRVSPTDHRRRYAQRYFSSIDIIGGMRVNLPMN